jgi:hypothetical protein
MLLLEMLLCGVEDEPESVDPARQVLAEGDAPIDLPVETPHLDLLAVPGPRNQATHNEARQSGSNAIAESTTNAAVVAARSRTSRQSMRNCRIDSILSSPQHLHEQGAAAAAAAAPYLSQRPDIQRSRARMNRLRPTGMEHDSGTQPSDEIGPSAGAQMPGPIRIGKLRVLGHRARSCKAESELNFEESGSGCVFRDRHRLVEQFRRRPGEITQPEINSHGVRDGFAKNGWGGTGPFHELKAPQAEGPLKTRFFRSVVLTRQQRGHNLDGDVPRRPRSAGGRSRSSSPFPAQYRRS